MRLFITLSLWVILTGQYVFAADDIGSLASNDVDHTVRGLINPQNTATISSEIPAKILSIPYKAGDVFKKNDVLVKFDCSLYLARLTSARADKQAKTKQYENNKRLLAYKATSDIEVELSKSEMEQAIAAFKVEKIRTRQCIINAPYAGRVIEVLANEHESVDTQTQLLSILSGEQLEIELIVPSNWLRWLKSGTSFGFIVDETGNHYAATVSRIGAMVDPVSQTIRIIGLFDRKYDDVLSGMSGTADFSQTR